MPAPFIRHSEVDVLIIAGPAGLLYANALANARVNVRIVDQRASKVTTGLGDGISPHTTEVLQSYGLAGRLLRESCQLHLVVRLSRRACRIYDWLYSLDTRSSSYSHAYMTLLAHYREGSVYAQPSPSHSEDPEMTVQAEKK
ncbi:hypothetical protein F4604DRAFT_1938543 [Suillus subluteus]|nr:hypothetical protein F4604DRAFT_1938543 [Suillus subluteus]